MADWALFIDLAVVVLTADEPSKWIGTVAGAAVAGAGLATHVRKSRHD